MRVNKISIAILFSLGCFLSACSVKTPPTTQYKLDAYNSKRVHSKPSPVSILVSQPDAVGGYQTEQMLYMTKPYELSSFVKNAWVSPPASMLFPLITQSLQDSGYFYAVVSPPYGDKATYRLDTQLIELQQNFIVKPSRIELVLKVVLTQVESDQIIASRIIHQQAICPLDTPYGGVIAANMAVKSFTSIVRDFVINHIQHDKRG